MTSQFFVQVVNIYFYGNGLLIHIHYCFKATNMDIVSVCQFLGQLLWPETELNNLPRKYD